MAYKAKFRVIQFFYQISREKLEPEPGSEPRTSGFLARRSTTSAILVLMPAQVRGSNPGSGSSFSLFFQGTN